MDSTYSLSNVSDLDNANILTLLYENEEDSSTYTLFMYGTGEIAGHFLGVGEHPWTGLYHSIDGLTSDAGFYGVFGSKITRLEIMNGITAIGTEAFEAMGGLSYVHIPGSVMTIEDSAFSGNGNLAQVDFDENFNGTFTVNEYNNASYAFTDSGWLALYAKTYLESVSGSGIFYVTVPIKGPEWKYHWWSD